MSGAGPASWRGGVAAPSGCALRPGRVDLGLPDAGEHLHLVRRDISAWGGFAKSSRSRVVPVDSLLVQAWDAYWWERASCRAA
ncbi:MAG TPA: hypothetical protein VGL46_14120 [Pseudonocardiaceae bacterium]